MTTHKADQLLSSNKIETKLNDSSQIPTTPSKTFTEYEEKATVYFFKRLKDIYGKKFAAQFPTDENLKTARKEWAKDIGKLSREQIDLGINRAKQELIKHNPDYLWPNIPAVIGDCKPTTSPDGLNADAYKVFSTNTALEDKTALEARRELGKQKMAELMKTIGL